MSASEPSRVVGPEPLPGKTDLFRLSLVMLPLPLRPCSLSVGLCRTLIETLVLE
jgi:hypothetical protein